MILGFIKEISSKRSYDSKKTTLNMFKKITLHLPLLNNKYKHLQKYLNVNKLIINAQLKNLLTPLNFSITLNNLPKKKKSMLFF